MTKALAGKLRELKLLILDVDGVLTDNGVYVGSDGNEFKKFHIHDGFGLYLLQQAGVEIALISGRYSKSTEFRAQELKIKHVYNGFTDKLKAYQELRDKLSLSDGQIGYVGDDLPDLSVMQTVGTPFSVANAQDQIKKSAHYVTKLRGGDGAVREIANLILQAKKRKKK